MVGQASTALPSTPQLFRSTPSSHGIQGKGLVGAPGDLHCAITCSKGREATLYISTLLHTLLRSTRVNTLPLPISLFLLSPDIPSLPANSTFLLLLLLLASVRTGILTTIRITLFVLLGKQLQ